MFPSLFPSPVALCPGPGFSGAPPFFVVVEGPATVPRGPAIFWLPLLSSCVDTAVPALAGPDVLVRKGAVPRTIGGESGPGPPRVICEGAPRTVGASFGSIMPCPFAGAGAWLNGRVVSGGLGGSGPGFEIGFTFGFGFVRPWLPPTETLEGRLGRRGRPKGWTNVISSFDRIPWMIFGSVSGRSIRETKVSRTGAFSFEVGADGGTDTPIQ